MKTFWKVWAISATALLVLVSACSMNAFKEKDESLKRVVQGCERVRQVEQMLCKRGICD